VSRLRLGLSREYFDCSLAVNGENDRETDGYTAVDYIRAIVGTLNSQYQKQPYGLGGMTTMYPASAFITHMVYLRGTTVKVDVKLITVGHVFSKKVDFLSTWTVNVGCQVPRSGA